MGFYSGPTIGNVVEEQGFYDGPAYTQVDGVAPADHKGGSFYDGPPSGLVVDQQGFYDGPSLEQLDPVVVGAYRDEAIAAAAAAKGSEDASAASAAASGVSASNSATSEASASDSAATATAQAGIATTKASEATTSETNAASSAATATTQAGIATTQAGTATTKAANAATSETNAATSATNAAASASAAATSATTAATVMAGSVRFDTSQTLTGTQQTLARTNINAVNKAGDTITGGLTVNGELVAATNYIRFVTSGSTGYLQWLGGATYSLGGAGNIWHTGNINPVSKAGDTMTGSLTVQGDIYAKRADNTSVVYLGTTGSYYLYWNGSYYTLASAHLYTAAGRVLGTSTDAGLIQNGRLVYVGDPSVNANGITEPYGGAVMTGFGWSSGATFARFRYMQLQNYNGTWFTIGYA